MRIAMLGLGLIGGSVVRALRTREPGGWSIAAWTPDGTGPGMAVADGLVDAAVTDPVAAIAGADLIVLAAPPLAAIGLLDDLAGPWRSALAPGAVITDVASTKSAIVLRATALGLPFVGGHPMAGRETSGFAAATDDLFVDRPWVVVPGGDVAAVERVESLARAVGARPVRLAAADHDAAVAGISHLPLIVASALVEAVAGGPDGPAADWPTASTLAASGWRDTTRLARGDVTMGTDIALTNAPAIAARLEALRGVLDAWSAALERPGGPDRTAIEAHLTAARERLGGPAT
jgi:prephenate dehydrogenase